MATTTITQVPPGVQAFYDRNLLARAQPAEVHGRYGQKRPIATRNGNQIKFRRYSQLAVASTPLTEGVTPAGSSLAVTDLTATLAQYGDFITLSDMVSMTNQDAVVTEATDVLGDQAGTTRHVAPAVAAPSSCRARLPGPKEGPITSGGVRTSALVPSPWRSGTITTEGPRRPCARRSARSVGSSAGQSPGTSRTRSA